jgi:GT2 family glycosyltransferase
MSGQPTFSVVVPTRDRPVQLERCAGALAALDYPPERVEVVVVDDGSRTAPRAGVSALGDRVRLVSQHPSGPASARNRGAAEACGAYLVFTDDDCAPAADWLSALERRLEGSPGATIAGRAVNALSANPYATASQLLVDYLYVYFNADGDRAAFLTSNNIAVAAEVFREIGGFDESFRLAGAEDRELCHRLRARGHPVVYAPEAVVHHAHPLTLRRFVGQHFRYGRGAARYRRVLGGRARTEPPGFWLGLLRAPGNGTGGRRGRLLGLLALSQASTAAGFAYETAMLAVRRLDA